MFDFHHKIEALEEQWGREKQELAKVKIGIFWVLRLTKVFLNQVQPRLVNFQINKVKFLYLVTKTDKSPKNQAIIEGERDLIQ